MKKDLCVVIGNLEVGGTERHLTMVLPLLVSRGWNVRVLVLSKRGALVPYLESNGVPVISVIPEKQLSQIQKLPRVLARGLRIAYCLIQLARYFRSEQPTILHFFLPEAYVLGMSGAWLAGFKGSKLMSRRSLNTYQLRRKGIAWCEKILHPHISMALGNSAAIIAQLKAERIPEDHLRLIYNGINVEPFKQVKPREICRKELGIANDALIFIMVANLIPYKGHHDLLEAFNLIQNQLKENWVLLCVGRDDGILKALQQSAEQLNVAKHILWLGSRSDVPDLLSAADIGILCSHEEGFSNAILEGMTAGLPMVVTDVGGNKEAVVEGETGYVVPPKAPKELADALLKLASSPTNIQAFGQLAKARVQQNFSLAACVNAYHKLYEECLEKTATEVRNICVE